MRVSLFVTCLADQFSPQAAAAAVRLLRRHGCQVDYPGRQTCCGQPAYNAGHFSEARAMARHFLRVFEGSDYVVSPSGSCTGMVRHYAEIFREDPAMLRKVWALAERSYELTQFLVDVLGVREAGTDLTGLRVAYHDSCHAMRLVGVREQPRQLLRAAGATLLDWDETCCGFGGLFSVKLPDLSGAMLERKLTSLSHEAGDADVLTSTDLGCLMQLGGGLSRHGSKLPVVHVAELLLEGRAALERPSLFAPAVDEPHPQPLTASGESAEVR